MKRCVEMTNLTILPNRNGHTRTHPTVADPYISVRSLPVPGPVGHPIRQPPAWHLGLGLVRPRRRAFAIAESRFVVEDRLVQALHVADGRGHGDVLNVVAEARARYEPRSSLDFAAWDPGPRAWCASFLILLVSGWFS